jgi:hypothetical protein
MALDNPMAHDPFKLLQHLACLGSSSPQGHPGSNPFPASSASIEQELVIKTLRAQVSDLQGKLAMAEFELSTMRQAVATILEQRSKQ